MLCGSLRWRKHFGISRTASSTWRLPRTASLGRRWKRRRGSLQWFSFWEWQENRPRVRPARRPKEWCSRNRPRGVRPVGARCDLCADRLEIASGVSPDLGRRPADCKPNLCDRDCVSGNIFGMSAATKERSEKRNGHFATFRLGGLRLGASVPPVQSGGFRLAPCRRVTPPKDRAFFSSKLRLPRHDMAPGRRGARAMLPPTLREFGHRRRRDLMHGPKSFQRRPPPSALPRLLDGRDGRDGTDGQQAARLPRERRSILSPQRLRPHGPDLRPNEGYAGITPTPTAVRVFGTFVRSAGTGTLNLACWFNHLSQRYPPQGLERPPHRYPGADVILPSFTTRTLVAHDVCRFKFAIRCPHAFAWLRALGDPGLGALNAQVSSVRGQRRLRRRRRAAVCRKTGHSAAIY